MPILNYSTSISADKTIGEITKILTVHGARRIMTEYNDRQIPSGIAFEVDTQFGMRVFRLPADVEAVWKVLQRQRTRGLIRSDRFVTKEQAARVSWRVLKDWIEAQMALIETEMVSLTQIMLPYMVSESGQTVYEAIEGRQLMLSSGEAGEM